MSTCPNYTYTNIFVICLCIFVIFTYNHYRRSKFIVKQYIFSTYIISQNLSTFKFPIMSKIQKKYKQNFYNKKPKKVLDINLRGFICSCNNREKDCVRESYNLLNKYADILYPPRSLDKEHPDIEDDLKDELEELRSSKKDKRFQIVQSGAKNFLFISTTLDDPVLLAEKIVSDIERTQTQQTRFLIRLMPIEMTCKAYVKDIENAFKPLAAKYFKDNPRIYSIVYNHRNNNSIKKDDVIKAVADVVSETRSDHKVNLKEAEVSIIIEVIKGIALIGVIPNFIRYKKYNLFALSGKLEGAKMEQSEADSGKWENTKMECS